MKKMVRSIYLVKELNSWYLDSGRKVENPDQSRYKKEAIEFENLKELRRSFKRTLVEGAAVNKNVEREIELRESNANVSVKEKKTPEELREIRLQNLKKAQETRMKNLLKRKNATAL